MANKIYLFLAILALAHFTFILAGSGMNKQPQKRLVGFVDLEEQVFDDSDQRRGRRHQ